MKVKCLINEWNLCTHMENGYCTLDEITIDGIEDPETCGVCIYPVCNQYIRKEPQKYILREITGDTSYQNVNLFSILTGEVQKDENQM